MDVRTPIIAVGGGLTTGLLVAVLVIELLDVEFSAILGLPAGLLTGVVVIVVLLASLEQASTLQQAIAAATAGFGYGVLCSLVASYVNLVSVDGATVLAAGGFGSVVAVLTVVLLDRRSV
jgi:hypothetical protein